MEDKRIVYEEGEEDIGYHSILQGSGTSDPRQFSRETLSRLFP